MTASIIPRVWVLRRPSIFDARVVWYVQRGCAGTASGEAAKAHAHEFATRAEAEAQRVRFPHYGVWRRGKRVRA